MKKMGADPDLPFVCFYARDGFFLRELFPRITSVFGEYSLSEHRNSSIENYLPVAETLTSLGYYAIRMGKNVEKAITPPNPQVVDYGAKFHSDFMDLYLSARCTFFVGNDGGMVCLPFIFRKPLVTVNAWPPGSVEGSLYHEGIFIPKTVYSSEKGDILSLRETLESDFAPKGFPAKEDMENLERKGFKLLENTPEEITEAAMEMKQRIQSAFEPSEEDEDVKAITRVGGDVRAIGRRHAGRRVSRQGRRPSRRRAGRQAWHRLRSAPQRDARRPCQPAGRTGRRADRAARQPGRADRNHQPAGPSRIAARSAGLLPDARSGS